MPGQGRNEVEEVEEVDVMKQHGLAIGVSDIRTYVVKNSKIYH